MQRRARLWYLLLLAPTGAVLGYGSLRDRAFVSEPYLTNPGTDRVTVRGFTAGRERWTALVEGIGAPPVPETSPTTAHRLELHDLPENKDLTIRVSSDRSKTTYALRYFTAGAGAPKFDFVVIGDSGGAPRRLTEFLGLASDRAAHNHPERVVAKMRELGPELVMHAGDVVYPDGARANYARCFFRPFGLVLRVAPIVACIGNHDVESEGGDPFFDVFAPSPGVARARRAWSSIDYGPLHVAIADSNLQSDTALEEQVRWLRDDLKSAKRPWKVLLTHVPIVLRNGAERDQVGPEQGRICDAIRAVAEDEGVSVVFAGHRHWYERTPPTSRGLLQFVTGGGGSEVHEPPPVTDGCARRAFHFLHGRVEEGRLSIAPIDFEGRPLEPATKIQP